MNRTKLKLFFIGFAVCTAITRYFVVSKPDFVEQYYSKGLFTGIRWVFDNTIFYSFIPMIYVFLVPAILYLIHILVRPFKKGQAIQQRIGQFLLSISSFISILFILFMWLWGFNYLRVPVEDSLQFHPKPIAIQDLKVKLQERLPALIESRNAIQGSTDLAIDTSYFPSLFEERINESVRFTLEQNNYPAKTRVQGRFLSPGVLLRLKTAGIYFPFVGESNIDAGLHPLQQSETLAHEFAHAYGFGDEGTCSFIAYLSLEKAEDPFIRYSVLLSYWRTLARNYLQHNNEDYQEFRKTLPAGIIADLNAIAENRKLYPSFFPNARNKIYDSYLKAQGIEEGLQNYNRVIMLVEGYQLSQQAIH